MKLLDLKEYCNNINIDFYYKDKINSTMKFAKIVNNSKINNSVFISDFQTSGKGRLGKKWISKKGNIFFTLKFLIDENLKNLHEISIFTCLEIKKTMENFKIKDVYIKWPNDIYVKNKKISGIITEIYNKDNLKFLLIGIGINFVSSPENLKYKTTYIKKYNTNIKKLFFLKTLIYNINKSFYNWKKNKKINFIKEYKKSLLYIGKNIIIENEFNESIKGKFIDITNQGFLIINSNNINKIIKSGSIKLKK